MELIDRYLHEIKRHLPRKNRDDILIELRSSLVDAVDDRTSGEASEEQVAEVLRDFGPPKQVAASYFPEGQYLIGPELYPLFRLVLGIALAAVIGAQVLAWAVAIFLAGDPLDPFNALAGLVNSLPVTLGWVVLTFTLLQRFGVHPDMEDEPWDPMTLPPVQEGQEVKRAELIVGVVVSILVLVLVVFYPEKVGFVASPDWSFYANPVIGRYLGWIVASLLAGIGLDIYLLWQGRWGTVTRYLKIGVNLLSILVLSLLVQGHTAWLAARDAGGFLSTLERFPELLEETWQLVGMHAFRLAFIVALIVTAIETLVLIYRMVKNRLQADMTSDPLSLKAS